jgi:hypothetical protein
MRVLDTRIYPLDGVAALERVGPRRKSAGDDMARGCLMVLAFGVEVAWT